MFSGSDRRVHTHTGAETTTVGGPSFNSSCRKTWEATKFSCAKALFYFRVIWTCRHPRLSLLSLIISQQAPNVPNRSTKPEKMLSSQKTIHIPTATNHPNEGTREGRAVAKNARKTRTRLVSLHSSTRAQYCSPSVVQADSRNHRFEVRKARCIRRFNNPGEIFGTLGTGISGVIRRHDDAERSHVLIVVGVGHHELKLGHGNLL